MRARHPIVAVLAAAMILFYGGAAIAVAQSNVTVTATALTACGNGIIDAGSSATTPT
jgi:hypothetical protein